MEANSYANHDRNDFILSPKSNHGQVESLMLANNGFHTQDLGNYISNENQKERSRGLERLYCYGPYSCELESTHLLQQEDLCPRSRKRGNASATFIFERHREYIRCDVLCGLLQLININILH